MENKEKIPSSDHDEDEDFNLLTAVNEHSEVIGLIEDDRDTNLLILNGQNSVPNNNRNIFPPPDNPDSDSYENNSPDDNENVEENGNEKNSLPNDNEIEIFQPPPDNPESDSDENNSHSDENVEENEHDNEEDEEHYMVYQEENNDIENNIHLPQITLINYVGDVENEEDFKNGWEWTEKDPGSSCGPFISQPGLLIEPASHTPKGF